ncbi:hypothetical protein [Solimicrobium silvestre]|uniref:Uncharacterized protein n=1 Tax=Solimicrobium silvestre TaxID=2099400 RepID=A0A2S9GT92_9BURK|nr:hypothetical protein [Solimicrobium silvestre]PRC90942.1 hypothetical protein S2091_4343 [Solimicrobium silvestre]
MTIEQTPQDEDKPQPQKSEITDFAGESRRRFTKAGLAASGVLMTLASRSLLACHEISPSGFSSVNQSTHGTPPASRCRRPYYWAGDCSWPIDKTTKFSSVFRSCTKGSPYYNYTCADVLAGKCTTDTNSYDCVGQYLVAAYLNACMGWSSNFLTTSQCLEMGNEWLQTKVYHPTAIVSWNCNKIVTYLQNVQA